MQENLLYWCDARTDKIERINLETGENREVVLASNNMDMFSVSVFEGYIYWSDRSVTGFAGREAVGPLQLRNPFDCFCFNAGHMRMDPSREAARTTPQTLCL